jgi:hypothetical protein
LEEEDTEDPEAGMHNRVQRTDGQAYKGGEVDWFAGNAVGSERRIRPMEQAFPYAPETPTCTSLYRELRYPLIVASVNCFVAVFLVIRVTYLTI